MQPMHLAIGIVEGIVTGSILSFVWNSRPEIFYNYKNKIVENKLSRKKLVTCFLVLTLIVGGFVSWFASKNPDGL